MATHTKDTRHQLTGDWTISGVAAQCEALSKSLQDLKSGRKKKIQIDCQQINSIDMSGLQLLHVWMECVRMRGVETQLLNLPDEMQQTIQQLGLGQCFTDNYPGAA
jgi:anti-anti-sigma factor